MRDEDPDFEPAYPVVAAGMRGVEGIEPDVYITDPTSGECSDLFNAVYELLLQMIARYFAFGHETPEQRKVLAHAAVGLMFQAIKPLGFLLARLPVGPDHPDVTVGANFQLPYRASFLLPHRRSAWLRFAERLHELAHFAAGLHPPGGEDVTATVSGALSRTASNLMSQVVSVCLRLPLGWARPSRGAASAEQPRESWFADTASVGIYVRGCQRTTGPANTTGSMRSSVAMAIYAASPSRRRC
jgi:hypothetical protein